MSEYKFKIGDVVRRKSGGQIGVVNRATQGVITKFYEGSAYIKEADWWIGLGSLELVQPAKIELKPKLDVKITIGADPEFFVKVGKTFKSAHGLVEGTKAAPFPLKDGAVQVDGMALEFNIDPCDTSDKFEHCITSVLEQVRGLVPEKYSFEFVPTAKFTPKHMEKQPPEALELGCEPDYDAYVGQANDKPEGPLGLRTAAGHVHIGIDRVLSELEKRKLVILCDIFLGLDSLSWDTDKLRRSMYGKAGCYRSKPYGIEYRTMSNAWVNDPKLRKRVFDGAVEAVNNLDNFEAIINAAERYFGGKYYECLPAVINESQVAFAHDILGKVRNQIG